MEGRSPASFSKEMKLPALAQISNTKTGVLLVGG